VRSKESRDQQGKPDIDLSKLFRLLAEFSYMITKLPYNIVIQKAAFPKTRVTAYD
jgi:hypothetical protein